ncbi:MAG: hypothetical protein LAT80_13430 [Balneolaceae bacterium]|nr:hypothetical protein [Balneolaceae bacterium]
MKYLKTALFTTLLSVLTAQIATSQNDNWKVDRKASILFGLSQPIVVNGFNIEANYTHNRFIFGYSHGMSLDFNEDLLPNYLQDQEVVVHVPFTTGFGIGYRFTKWLNLRVEPKWHRFEFYYEGEAQNNNNRIAVDKNNISVGLGLYGFFQPFDQKNNLLKGITIAPSVRYWPTIASSFSGDRFIYENRRTGQTEELKTLSPGIGFTPVIVNVSIGYSFGF